MIEIGTKVRCRQSGETGAVIEVICRGETLRNLYRIAWDDIYLAEITLGDSEFDVIEED